MHKSLNDIGASASKIATGIGSTISKVSKMALSAITASSTALSGLGLAAFNEGKKFESAFAGVKKTVEGTEAQFEALRQGILDMSERMPESAADIAAVAEAAGQLGIATDNILDFTETMTMLGTATNLTADEAATALARFANITQMSPDNFDKLGATIVALGNNFATTESEIVAMATRIASTGEIVGLSENEIMALAATLSSLGIEAEVGGSAISRVMKDIEVAAKTGNGNLENYASVANMTVESFSKLWESSPVEALDAFVAGLNDVERNGASAIEILDDMDIKEIRMSNSLLALSTSNGLMTKAINLANTAWEENTALTNEATQRYETLDSKLTMLKSSAQNLGIYVYEGMELPLKSAADKGISYISQLQKAFKTDGLRGLVTEFSNIFVDILTFGAEKAPDFFKMGSDFLMSIANGIRNNSDRIFDAFVTVLMQLPDFILTNVSALFSIGSLFVDKLAQGIGENADNIGSAAADLLVKFANFLIVNIPKLASAAAQIVKAFAKEIGNQVPLLKPFTKLLELAGTAVEKFGTEIGATIIAVMSFKKINNIVQTFGLLNKALKDTGGLLPNIKKLFLNLGNPIGIAISAVGGLAAGFIALERAVKAPRLEKMRQEIQASADATNTLTERIDDSISSFESAAEAAESNAIAQLNELNNTSKLIDELDKYVDSNGKVKEGYEDRVNMILGDLASATGAEISQIEDGIIPAYDDMKSKIAEVIEQKKALSQIESMSDAEIEAQKLVDTYGVESTRLQKDIDAREKEMEEYQEYMREIAISTGAQDYETFSLPMTSENKELYRQAMSDESFEKFYGENGIATLWEQAVEEQQKLNGEYKEAAILLDSLAKAKEAYYEGDFEKAQELLKINQDANRQIVEDSNSTNEEITNAYKEMLEGKMLEYKKNVELGLDDMAEKSLEELEELVGESAEQGIDAGEEWTTEYLSELAKIDGFDTTKLMNFIAITAGDGGKLAVKYAGDEIQGGLEGIDYSGIGISAGSALGIGFEQGVLPHINAVSSMISGLQSAASTLSSSAEMAMFKLRQAQYEQSQGGSGGGGSTTTNNTYNGGSASGRTSAQKTAAYKNSVKGGVGGG